MIATVEHAHWFIDAVTKMLLVGTCDFFDHGSECVVAGVVVGIGFARRLQGGNCRETIDFQT